VRQRRRRRRGGDAGPVPDRAGPLAVHNQAGTALQVRPDASGPPGAAFWVSGPVAITFRGQI
jgi:hypothetical protein